MYGRIAKPLIDLLAAALGLLCLSPLLLVAAVLIKLDSEGPVFFRQTRVGRAFRTFDIYKFRTMVQDAPRLGRSITPAGDPRVTRVGRLLRATKLDELPQLINVLNGEMSLVGPRPEVPVYVDRFRTDYEHILTVRPGITDLASLKYRNEGLLLGGVGDPEDLYVKVILPEKLSLAREYVRRQSLLFDLVLISRTLAALSGVTASR